MVAHDEYGGRGVRRMRLRMRRPSRETRPPGLARRAARPAFREMQRVAEAALAAA